MSSVPTVSVKGWPDSAIRFSSIVIALRTSSANFSVPQVHERSNGECGSGDGHFRDFLRLLSLSREREARPHGENQIVVPPWEPL